MTVSLAAVLPWLSGASEEAAAERVEAWRIHSLLDAGRLHQRNVFQVAFDHEGSAWLATSDGLYRYDGYEWRRYGEADGLPSAFVRAVLWDLQGQLWVGTDRGAGTFDGRHFDPAGSDTGLPGPSVRRIRQDPDGSIWFCCDRWPDAAATGGVARLYQGRWERWTRADEPALGHSMDYYRDSRGRQLVLTQTGLLQRDGDRWFNPLAAANHRDSHGTFWSIAEVPGVGVMANTFESLFFSNYESWQRADAPFPVLLQVGATRGGEFLGIGATTPSSCAFQRWNGQRFEPASEAVPFPAVNVVSLVEAPDGSIWCAGHDYLLRWDRSQTGWTEFGKCLPPPVLADRQNRVWFADSTAARRWTGSQLEPIEGFSGGGLAQSPNGEVWGWTTNRILRWDGDQLTEFGVEQMGLSSPAGCTFDLQGRVWFHNEAPNHLLAFSRFDGQRWESLPQLPYRPGSVSSACPDTTNGVWYSILNLADGVGHLIHWSDAGPDERPLVDSLTPFSRPMCAVDRQGNCWLYGGTVGLQRWNASRGVWMPIPGLIGGGVNVAVESQDAIWFALHGFLGGRAGLARFKDEVWNQYEADPGTSAVVGQQGTLYFPGDRGLYVVAPGIAPHPLPVTPPLTGRVTGLVEDHHGRLWLGVGNQVLRYVPHTTPPHARVLAQEDLVRQDRTFSARLEGVHRYEDGKRQPESFRFAHRIDGGAWGDWKTDPSITVGVGGLKLGRHQIDVRAQGLAQAILAGEPSEAQLPVTTIAFTVTAVPIQERVWFTPTVTGFIILLGAMALGLRSTSRKLARHARNLQSTVAERTASLQAAVQRERLHFEQTPLAAIEWDLESRVVRWNPAAESIFGFPANEAIGKPASFILPEPSRAHFGQIWHALLQNQAGEWSTQRNVRRDGQITLCEWCNTPLVDAEGRVIGVASLVQDISARQREQQERLDLERRLLHSQKLESLGVLSGGIAHDFNNLLAAMLGNLELALADLAPGSKARPSLDEAARAAKRAADLTRQLLAYSGKGRFVVKALNLSELVAENVHMLRAAIPKTITLQLQLADRIPFIHADPGQTQQVIMNLITNAAEAIGDRPGVVSLSTGLAHADPETLAHSRLEQKPAPGDFVFLEIRDTGCGMDTETQQRLFDPFFTTKFTGRGLGMSAVLGILRGHGGAILVQSEPGKGTTIRVLFPAVPNPNPQATESSRAPTATVASAPEPMRGSMILVVDDEEAIRNVTERALRRLGYSCLLASDGEQAIQVFRKNTTNIGCVLLDLTMPNKDGLATFKELQQLHPAVKAILCSGFTEEAATPRFEGQGLAGFLQKPYDLHRLNAELARVLGGPSSRPARG